MKVPVIVLTGFLGSGKTTLLNRMIAARALGGATDKIALIVNELGAVGIDGALLPAEMTRQVELPGGCICCTLNEDLDRTIVELLARSPEIVRIVIETTGVAEPLPIAWAMEREPLEPLVRLEAVVTLVDVTGFLAQRSVSQAVDAQVAYADVVVLTKTDLGPSEEVAAAVRQLAPNAVQVVGLDALREVLEEPREPGRRPEHAHDHPHDHGIDAVWVEVPGVVDAEELGDLLAELPGNYLRIKGIVRGPDGWIVIHRVGLRVSSEPLPPRSGLSGRLVALGTGVDRDPLERAVVSCTIRTAP